MIRFSKQLQVIISCLILLVFITCSGQIFKKDKDSDDNAKEESTTSGTNSSTDQSTSSNSQSMTEGTDNSDSVFVTDNSALREIPSEEASEVTVDIVMVVDEESEQMQLVYTLDQDVSASAWSITISNCTSGYGPVVDQNSPDYLLYRGDQDCEAGLLSFTFEGVDFTNMAGAGVPCTGAVGTICTFENTVEQISLGIEIT